MTSNRLIDRSGTSKLANLADLFGAMRDSGGALKLIVGVGLGMACAGGALAARVTCTASLSTAGLLTIEVLDAGGAKSLTTLAVNKTIPLGFAQSSASTSASTCYDNATLSATSLFIPDVLVGTDYYNLSLKPVDTASKLYSLDSAAKNPRLVPDAGFRVTAASNPFASVDAGGTATLGYQDRSSSKEIFQTASDGLTFGNATTLSYSNRQGDSRKTLMPDGKTWRLYQYNTGSKTIGSYSSTDGNVFTAESGTRYAPTSADNASIGVYDAYVATDGAVILIYVGDLLGKNNLRMARSTDNGVTFSFLKGNVLGDDDAGGGGNTFIDNKTLLLADGRRRMVTMRANEIHSFISTDGLTYSRELGVRMKPSDFAAVGVTIYSLNDPVMVRTKEGGYRVYAAASTVLSADEAAGNTNWGIVSALWSETTVAAPTGVAVANVDATTLGESSFSSSTKLAATWTRPSDGTVDHYRITATEAIGKTSVSVDAVTTATGASLTGLKSATAYSIVVSACKDTACATSASASAVSATTSAEYWQLQGSGHSASTVNKLVTDGNTLHYAFVYGDWADAGLRNYLRYYYNPFTAGAKGSKPAISTSLPVTGNAASATQFTGLPGYGVTYSNYESASTTPLIPTFIGQSVGVPYQDKIRLFYEATAADGRTRIWYLDSADGYTGLDFNTGSATLCSSNADFASACKPTLVLGVEADGTAGNKNIIDIRQFKIGYPTLNSWLWDGKVGTFMMTTFDLPAVDDKTKEACGASYKFTTGYALWDGAKWTLQYQSDGKCPKIFDGVQAPSVVHLGGNNYKLYFSNNKTLMGTPFDPRTATKPMKVIYANGSSSSVAFEEWESVTSARELVYLWPDGTVMSTLEESKLDDYHFLTPTQTLAFQVQYSNYSDGTTIPFGAGAVLLNP